LRGQAMEHFGEAEAAFTGLGLRVELGLTYLAIARANDA